MIDDNQIKEIENKLNYAFTNKQLVIQAFTHSSYANIEKLADNERMEFFGDAILEYIVSEYLFSNYPMCSAGELSAMRANLVSADGLRPMIDSLDVIQYLQVANGSGKIKKLSRKIEANLFEAILCAIYLDGGMECAKQFALRLMSESLRNADATLSKDGKTLLQEYCQKYKKTLQYQLINRSGPDNSPKFEYALYIDGKEVSRGVGSSIKAAEQDAANKIVHEWRID